MRHSDMSLSMVAAKFKRPHLPRVALRRETFDILSRAFERRLAVVCAPAGYGKTTMAGAVTAGLDHECLWYRLDALDHDPVVFVRALIEAFRRPFPEFGDVLLERLRADAESPLRTDELLAMFVREADEEVEGPVHLVLDDYHEAAESPALNHAIDYLLASLPPRYHLVVLTRYEPVFSTARLKVAGELSLVDAGALRFDHAQAGAVIASLSGSDPAEDKVARLLELTEGWPAAIVLAAMTLSWRRLDSLEETLSNPRLRQDVYSYLAEQAYQREDASTRTFLTRTCCLEDITPQLAERLSGAEDSAGRLDRLAAKGVFTFPAQPGAYRYHNLFREYLQHRVALDAGERTLRHLQMETAEALEDAGRFELAVELFLGLPEPARALETIARAAESVLEDSRTEQLRTWVSRLRAGGVGQHPWTRVLAGVLSMRDGRDEEAAAAIEAAYADFAALEDDWGMFHAASVRETLAFWLGDAPGAEAWSRTSLDHAQSRRQRTHAHISLGAALEQMCDWAGAQQAYEEAAACADDSVRDEVARAQVHVTNILASRGSYRMAQAKIAATDAFTSAWARPNIRVGWRNTAGVVWLAVGDSERARSYLEAALEESERLGFGFYSALILDGLGQLEVARGRYASGRELSLQAAESPALTTDVFSRSFAYCHVGTAWRREGRARMAIDAYERALLAGHAKHAALPYLNTLANLAFLSQMTTPARPAQPGRRSRRGRASGAAVRRPQVSPVRRYSRERP